MSGVDPQIAQWFRTVDKDHSGRLTADQLQAALRNNNYSTFDLAVVQSGFVFPLPIEWPYTLIP